MKETIQSMREKKEERLEAIKVIISNHFIRSQEELVERLKEDFGVESNQSTISRDISSLKLRKDPQTNCYQLEESVQKEEEKRDLKSVLDQAKATYLDESVSMVAFKVDPVFASLIAAKLEAYFSDRKEVIGTLVGSSGTLLLLVTNNGDASIRREINNILSINL